MLGNTKFGSVVHKLWSQTMLWTRVPFREYLRHTRATSFQTNENLGLYSFFHGLSTLKQCDFNQKNIHFGSVVHKLCPKTPKFCWFGAKMGLAHNFTRNDILSYVRTFYGLTTSKQCDLHLQTSFLGACLMFIGQFGYGPGSGPGHANVCVTALS